MTFTFFLFFNCSTARNQGQTDMLNMGANSIQENMRGKDTDITFDQVYQQLVEQIDHIANEIETLITFFKQLTDETDPDPDSDDDYSSSSDEEPDSDDDSSDSEDDDNDYEDDN